MGSSIHCRGVSLSGGQKARFVYYLPFVNLAWCNIDRNISRVALARAVYARTKFVLLDDPLSAVVSP
jgi:hypothetical protein